MSDLVPVKFQSTFTPGRTASEVIAFGRLSYTKSKNGHENLFDERPQTNSAGQIIGNKGGWGASLLISPRTDYKPFMTAAMAVMAAVHGPDQKKWPSRYDYRTPRGPEKDNIIRPVDLEKNPGFDGWETMPFATYGEPPVIVGPTVTRITDRKEVYSGRWAFVAINLYWMKGATTPGQVKAKGLSCGLQSIQLMHHDDKIGGGVAAPDAYFQRQDIGAEEAGPAPSGGVWGDESDAVSGSPFD